MFAVAEYAIAHPGPTSEQLDRAVRSAPAFRNTDFELPPVPLCIRESKATEVASSLAAYVRLLGKVVSISRRETAVQDWFGLDRSARLLLAAEGEAVPSPWVCRLDGYVEAGSGELRILENNADAPAGTLFTPRINCLIFDALAALGLARDVPAPLTYMDEQVFVDSLLEAAKTTAKHMAGKESEPVAAAVLAIKGRESVEVVEMVETLRRRGLDAQVADPRSLEVRRGQAFLSGMKVDLCWNKVNTCNWLGLCQDEQLVRRWAAALETTPLVHVNSFGSRYVAESKLALAFLQEEKFQSFFTEEERLLVSRLLPWTRRIVPGAKSRDGQSLIDDLLARPGAYVLKDHYDIRGDGVTIGVASDAPGWQDAVANAVRTGNVAQEFVRPTTYPDIRVGHDQVHFHSMSLDTFLFGGRPIGFGSKAGGGPKVNVFQGGKKVAVHVTAGEVSG